MEEVIIGALSNSKLPHTAEEFDTIILTCKLIKHLNRLIAIWNRFVATDSLHPLQDRKDIFIDKLLNGRNEIEAAINWWRDVYEPFREQLSDMKVSSGLLRENSNLKPEERIHTARVFINILTRGSSSKTPVPSRMEQKCSVRLFLTTPECAVFFANAIVKY